MAARRLACGPFLSRILPGWLLLLVGVWTPRVQAFWVTGYYPGYEQSTMPASSLDFTTVTHVIHFALTVLPDGTVDPEALSIQVGAGKDLVSRAHAAGRQVLICVGGAGSQEGFRGATKPATLPTFTRTLTNWVAAVGYDGIDLDWEPLSDTDLTQWSNLVKNLRTALNRFPTHKSLTAAIPANPEYGDSPTLLYQRVAAVQDQFDQLNIMTYDFSGPWPGWVTWFNAPIFDGGFRFPSTGEKVPSTDGSIRKFLSQGVSSQKLGVGIAFYGVQWSGSSGVTGPRQSWPESSPPDVVTLRYADIQQSLVRPDTEHWDAAAQSAYLSIRNPANATLSRFVSYENPRACQAKVSYARNLDLGGVMIWELSQDYFPGKPLGQRNPLIQSIHDALESPGRVDVRQEAGEIVLHFAGIPMAGYRVERTDNLTGGSWQTMQVVQCNDPECEWTLRDALKPDAQVRFYRVRTPP